MIARVNSTPVVFAHDTNVQFLKNLGPGRVVCGDRTLEVGDSVEFREPLKVRCELPDHLEGNQANVLVARVPKPTVDELEARILALESKGA